MRVFYRKLEDNLYKISTNEKLVYSMLVYKSVSRIDEIYVGKTGKCIDKSNLEFCFKEYDNYIPYTKISIRNISEESFLSIPTVISCIKKLKSIEIIKNIEDEEYIYLNEEIYNGGFENLEYLKELKGNLLEFYIYLKNKSFPFNGSIDTYRSKMSIECGFSIRYISEMISKLVKLGLIKREGNKTYILKNSRYNINFEEDDEYAKEISIYGYRNTAEKN